MLISGYGMFHFLDAGVLALSSISALELPLAMLFASSLVFLFVPRLLSLAIHLPAHRARGFGGKDKLAWSILLETLFSLLFSPVQMIAVTHFLWQWLKRKTVTWGAQARGDNPLPWETCLRHFGWITIVGVIGLTLIIQRTEAQPAISTALLQTFSAGLLTPIDLIVWLFPVLVGFAASLFIVRVTSFTFPSVARRKLFATPEELQVPPVVAAVVRWEGVFNSVLPPPQMALQYALSDSGFYVRQRRETTLRPTVSRRLLKQIEAGHPPRRRRLSSGTVGTTLLRRHSRAGSHYDKSSSSECQQRQ